MENRPNLTHQEIREYLLSFYYYCLGEIEKIVSSVCGKELKLTGEMPDLMFQFMAETVAKNMLAGDKDARLFKQEDRDGLIEVFYQCLEIDVQTLEEGEKEYLSAAIDHFLDQETSGDSPSSLSCEQAWKMIDDSLQVAAKNGVSLNDPLSLQAGWNEAIRMKYPAKEDYLKKTRDRIISTTQDPRSFSLQMKVAETIARRAYGEEKT